MSDDVTNAFLSLSATLTGYTQFRLLGTGQADMYLEATRSAVGDDILDQLLTTFANVHKQAGGDGDALDRGLRATVLSDDKLGPVARNVIKMWFVGTWYELPQEWRDLYSERQPVSTRVVSAASYTEGLLWPTIGANPPGAKAQGFASWVGPPAVDVL
ncbi:MAG: hypothetical protein ACXVXP_10020 [Mycobacteriaceae bacterium]